MKDAFVFAVNRKDNRHFNAIDDFRELEVGVVQGTPTVQRLKKLGFKNLQPVMQEKQNAFKMIYGNRIDAWYTAELILIQTIKTEGIKSDKIKIVYKDIDVEMYIAASLSVPDEIVSQWQKNFDGMKKSGQYQQILKQYGHDP
jgi:polar amino acid transport system substrate-binding protein